MGFQFLGDNVFVNGTNVHIDIIVEQPQLNAIHVHGGEKTDIVGEKLEGISLACEFQRRARFVQIVGWNGYSCFLQP